MSSARLTKRPRPRVERAQLRGQCRATVDRSPSRVARWRVRSWLPEAVRLLLYKPPRQADGQDASDDALQLTGDAPVGNWTWHGVTMRRSLPD